MQHVIHSVEFAVLAVSSYVFGKLTILATASAGGDQPAWLQWIMGPLGALVVMVFAIGWLTKRLDASEKREIERQQQREAMLQSMAVTNAKIADALDLNNEVLEKVNAHLTDCNKK